MRTTVDRLILDAVVTGKNTSASDGRWTCRVNHDVGAYIVRHHATDMLIYHGPRANKPGMVFPLDPGHGSVSDKQGVNSMLMTLGAAGHRTIAHSYNELYSGKAEESSRIQGPVNEQSCTGYVDDEGNWHHDGDTCPIPEHTKTVPKPDLEPFTPPLTVEDTMG